MVNYLFYIFFFASLLLFLILVILLMVFGRLMRLQIKRWFLASKGYVEVEHISPTKIRNYFILRPVDFKFDIAGGFYHYIPECITRKGEMIQKYDKEFWNKSSPDIAPDELEGLSDADREKYIKRKEVEFAELKKLYTVIAGLNYDPQLLNRKLGMPVITYYGDNPDPLNPADRSKVYGSGVIKDMYLRLLLTQRYKDFRFLITIMLVALGIIAIALGYLASAHSTDAKNYVTCLRIINDTLTNYNSIINATVQAGSQSTVVPI